MSGRPPVAQTFCLSVRIGTVADTLLVATLPILIGIVAIAGTLVLNARRRRGQRFGTLDPRIAPPTRLVAAVGFFSSLRFLGIAALVAVIILLTQGKASVFLWSVLVFGVALTVVGFVGRARASQNIRRDRDRFSS